ncbi:guanine nucleotide exchange protein smcr8b [Corythoichthys intestinalis]|uniref:guanine nucleotide exchange protein smcr8b n=1 Tax=Corythoichthys intestinalis TaxID=161448 RepID=UPI0025A51F07|nr:guanine nucleotide exchange protein smcr8b [Corythoichthys intestinalis]
MISSPDLLPFTGPQCFGDEAEGDSGGATAWELPEELSVPPLSSSVGRHPWFSAAGFQKDFVLVAEFSEQVGPTPVMTIPEQAGESESLDLNHFSVRIMSVDYQASGPSPASSSAGPRLNFNEDSEVVLGDSADWAFAYVRHVTLLDLAARGMVRPFCMAYVCSQQTKIMENFSQLSAGFRRAADSLKTGNRQAFSLELHNKLHQLQCKRLALLKNDGISSRGEKGEELEAVEQAIAMHKDLLRQVTSYPNRKLKHPDFLPYEPADAWTDMTVSTPPPLPTIHRSGSESGLKPLQELCNAYFLSLMTEQLALTEVCLRGDITTLRSASITRSLNRKLRLINFLFEQPEAEEEEEDGEDVLLRETESQPSLDACEQTGEVVSGEMTGSISSGDSIQVIGTERSYKTLAAPDVCLTSHLLSLPDATLTASDTPSVLSTAPLTPPCAPLAPPNHPSLQLTVPLPAPLEAPVGTTDTALIAVPLTAPKATLTATASLIGHKVPLTAIDAAPPATAHTCHEAPLAANDVVPAAAPLTATAAAPLNAHEARLTATNALPIDAPLMAIDAAPAAATLPTQDEPLTATEVTPIAVPHTTHESAPNNPLPAPTPGPPSNTFAKFGTPLDVPLINHKEPLTASITTLNSTLKVTLPESAAELTTNNGPPIAQVIPSNESYTTHDTPLSSLDLPLTAFADPVSRRIRIYTRRANSEDSIEVLSTTESIIPEDLTAITEEEEPTNDNKTDDMMRKSRDCSASYQTLPRLLSKQLSSVPNANKEMDGAAELHSPHRKAHPLVGISSDEAGLQTLRFVKQNSFSHHAIFCLLSGRPLVLLSMDDAELRKSVDALTPFLPAPCGAVMPRLRTPLQLSDLLTWRLIGIHRSQSSDPLHWLSRYSRYVGVLDLDHRTLRCPAYSGSLVGSLVGSAVPTGTFLTHVKCVLTALAKRVLLFTFAQQGQEGLDKGDLSVMHFLSDLIKQQHIGNGPPVMRFYYMALHVHKNTVTT